jgi:NAD(P)-dependent dehydrogenase (short-subunit alcohol dehydrogenase family)
MDAERITSRFGARSTALDVVEGIDLAGRRAVVTGGAAGLGLETSRALAAAGARVTLAVRNLEQGRAAAAQIGHGAEAAPLDLADLASVARFVRDWGDAPLSILVANAAIMACPLTRTPQGWEMQFAVNHLGHFALVRGLLPALRRGAPARLVMLSSTGHKIAGVDFDDPHFERRDYNKWVAYGQAKSANALTALAVHLRHAGDGITANAVHPGGIMTGLQKFLPIEEQRALGWLKEDDTPLDLFKTPEQGAATSVWAATAPEIEGHGGLYLEDCAQGVPQPPTNRVFGFSPHIADPAGAQRLWELSVRTLG